MILIIFFSLLNAKPVQKVHLTPEEQKFIKSHPKIVLGTSSNWEPYVIQNSDGSISGYDHDILSMINKVTGANFVQVTGAWSDMQKMAKSRKIDGLSTLIYTKEREKFLNFSDIYISLKKMVMVKQRNPLNIQLPLDLSGKTIVITKGNVADEIASKKFVNTKIIYAKNPKEMLQEVIYGKADATFGNGATEYMLSKLGLPYMENAFVLDDSLDLRFALRKDWKEAISILNKGLKSISLYERTKLKQKWFFTDNKLIAKVKLQKEEFLYLNNKKTIKMCIDPKWMPLEALKNGKYVGLSSDYMKLFSKSINTPISLVKTSSWLESLEKIKSRECDILPLVQATPKRAKYLDFTSSYLDIPLVISTKIGVPFIDNITQIEDKKLGVVKGYSITEKLKLKYPNINIVEVDSLADGLKEVEDGTIFGYLDNSIVMNYEIQKNYIGTLTISGKFQDKLALSVATRNDEKILKQIFEKLVLSIDEGTKQEILNKWVDTLYQKNLDYTLILKIVALFIFILLVGVYRQYHIKKINTRLKDEITKAIVKSKEQDKIIFQQNKLAVLGDMIGCIAHQWRQPLAVVNTAIAILLERDKQGILSQEKLREKLYSMELNVQQMSQTIEDFLSYFKPNKEKETFILLESVEKTLLMMKDQIEHNTIKITLNIDSNISINSYRDEYMQVLISILTNSIQAFKVDSMKAITISAYDNEHSVLLVISDNANGIDEKILDNIFDPYFTTKHQSKGTGLGLYISKMIIENSMGGRLSVKNIANGVEFLIEIDK
jgi:ABC-type amino acid transport substrate-binding protein/nitrogen-specific signal transduction histidine kinase